jgi:hypothetical protein
MIELAPQATPVVQFNMATANPGDIVAVPSVEEIDLAVKFLGHQFMVICGHQDPFSADSRAFFGQRESFRPVSEAVILGADPGSLTDPRLYILGTPRAHPNEFAGGLRSPSAPNYFKHAAGKIAATVTIERDNADPLVQGMIFDLHGYNSQVKMQKLPGHFLTRTSAELQQRLNKGVGASNHPAHTVQPNAAVKQQVENLSVW